MVLKNDSELLIKKFTVFLPFKSTCIQRSLTIYRYSARKGIKADFMVGVRLAPYMFHCWLTYNGEIVFDSPADSKYYQTKAIKINEYFGMIPSHINTVSKNNKQYLTIKQKTNRSCYTNDTYRRQYYNYKS